MTEAAPTLVFVEHVLWTPGAEWRGALDYLAGRFARVAPLDVDALLACGPLHVQLEGLVAWAEGPKVDLDRELGRYLDEHLSMHVRPNAALTRAVRAQAARGPVHAVSALPARAAEGIARHGGSWRSFAALHAGVRTAADLDAVLAATGATALVAGATTPRTAPPLTDVSIVDALAALTPAG